MKRATQFLAAAAALALSGCGHLDLSPEGDPSRVLTGEVRLGEPMPLPSDAVVTVRTHVYPTGYASEAMRGSVRDSFKRVTLDPDFAAGLAHESPLPDRR